MPANADVRAPPKRASGELCFLLTKTYMDVGNPGSYPQTGFAETSAGSAFNPTTFPPSQLRDNVVEVRVKT
jgi:hypothetical protein